jgi:hypothetical protein
LGLGGLQSGFESKGKSAEVAAKHVGGYSMGGAVR